MAENGKRKTFPAHSGLRGSGGRGFLPVVYREDLPNVYGVQRGLVPAGVAVTNLSGLFLLWHFCEKRNTKQGDVSSSFLATGGSRCCGGWGRRSAKSHFTGNLAS
jgi:hypothetical protein